MKQPLHKCANRWDERSQGRVRKIALGERKKIKNANLSESVTLGIWPLEVLKATWNQRDGQRRKTISCRTTKRLSWSCHVMKYLTSTTAMENCFSAVFEVGLKRSF